MFKVLYCSSNSELGPWGVLPDLTADSFSLPTRLVPSRQLLLARNPFFALALSEGEGPIH